MKRQYNGLLVLVLALALLAPVLPAAAQYGPSPRCFPETELCLEGMFKTFWENNGGLAVFGFPITAMAPEYSVDSDSMPLTQWLERNRFELHASNPDPYKVLLGRLGADQLAQRGIDWEALPRESGPQDGCLWFAETGHNVCNQSESQGFKRYWESHGLEFGDPGVSYRESLALFGLPLTAPRTETNSSGDTVLTQWFERARFEWHPNNPEPYKVLLGRLGAEVRSEAEAVAAQTILDYYRAINDRAYNQAYRLWKDQGAASGQSFAQFQQGYQDTVRVSVILGDPRRPSADSHAVSVDVTLLAVVNHPDAQAQQRAQVFAGSYTLEPARAGESSPTGWVIAGSDIVEERAARLPPAGFQTAEQTLLSYYQAIQQRSYARAYSAWEELGQASGQSLLQFRVGFSATAEVALELGTPRTDAGAGQQYARVPVVIASELTDGSRQTFCGYYDLQRANLAPFDKLGWRIDSAQIVETDTVPLNSEQSRRLLTGGCPAH